MKAAGLSGCCPRRRVYTTRTDKDAVPAADLVDRRILAEAPDRLSLADITYVPTLEDWLYLAFVLDAYSRSIVGWSMGEHLLAELVGDALATAVARRKPGKG